ncbi:type III PLP-dependent enzyme [Streptomyces sp. NPDC014793]|uniref:type III PLP-dependent enzyme n=1 Tax=Streptomyces sp. NPDC014793 TaxID=3364914 RepID=UPI0037004A6E
MPRARDEVLHARLAAEYGTPLYVYDLDDVAEAKADLFSSLPEGVDLYYALKANPHPDLVRTLGEEGPGAPGCGTEISSTGELAAVLAAGLPAAGCLYTGPGKTAHELDEAIRLGVRLFSTDSVTDVRRLDSVAARRGVRVGTLLRVNAASATATTSIRMTGTPSQFGFDSEDLAGALAQLRGGPAGPGGLRAVDVTGMHFFPLSNTTDEDNLIGEFRNTLATAAELSRVHELPLRYLDIGGGFSVPYGVPGGRTRYPKLRTELEAALDVEFPHWRDGSPRIAFESGRYLAGGSGTLLATVTNVKVSRGRKFVITDAGINTFGGMSGLGRLLPVAVEPAGPGEPVQRASLVGPLCTPGDVLGREIELPELAPGDLLAIPNAGAYGPTASLLMFLGRPAPTEVTVRDGAVVSASRLVHSRSPR